MRKISTKVFRRALQKHGIVEVFHVTARNLNTCKSHRKALNKERKLKSRKEQDSEAAFSKMEERNMDKLQVIRMLNKTK